MTFSQKKILTTVTYILVWFILGYLLKQYIPTYLTNTSVNPNIDNQTLTENIFSSNKIQKTINIIRKYSYGFDKKSVVDIEDAMLKSVVNWLGDKHSTYFTQKDASEFEEALRGDFEWIGAVISEDFRWIKITKIIVASPADKAGLKAGDIMIRVWNTSIVGKSIEDAVKVIRWPKGTKAEIVYKRWDDNTELQMSVTRDRVNVPSVAEKLLDDKIGYIEIATFWEHTSTEFVKSWNNLSASGAQGIILDFRNNGGGYLDTAVDLASIVLPVWAPVVIIKQNDITKNEVLHTKEWIKNNTKIPIIILINNFSASASEIFAWAIQDNGRWLLLGEKSYGKWSVQEPFELWDGSIVKITTARWYTPKDTSIDEKWIAPDTTVILTNRDYENIFDRQLKAAEIIIKDQISMTGSILELKEKYKNNTFTTLKK